MRALFGLILVASTSFAAAPLRCDPSKMNCLAEGIDLCPTTLTLWEKQPANDGAAQVAFASCSMLLTGACQEGLAGYADGFERYFPRDHWLRDALTSCVTPEDCAKGGGICGKSTIDLDEATLRAELKAALVRRLNSKLTPEVRKNAEGWITRWVALFSKPPAPGVRSGRK
jgi:hypothetical protein